MNQWTTTRVSVHWAFSSMCLHELKAFCHQPGDLCLENLSTQNQSSLSKIRKKYLYNFTEGGAIHCKSNHYIHRGQSEFMIFKARLPSCFVGRQFCFVVKVSQFIYTSLWKWSKPNICRNIWRRVRCFSSCACLDFNEMHRSLTPTSRSKKSNSEGIKSLIRYARM